MTAILIPGGKVGGCVQTTLSGVTILWPIPAWAAPALLCVPGLSKEYGRDEQTAPRRFPMPFVLS